MPRSEDVANSFMSEGRGGDISTSESFDVDVCYPQNATNPKFDTQGRHKAAPIGVDYDMKPEVKNPRSVSDQNPEYDSQGK